MLLNIVNQKIKERLESNIELIHREIKNQIIAQGHNNSGDLINSLRTEINQFPNVIQSLTFMLNYGEFVNNGVDASRIPFNGSAAPGQGTGKTSKYIQGLQRFFILKGESEEDALSYAFATAHKHKKEGMPTRSGDTNSFDYTQNGKRTGFLDDAIENLQDEILKIQTEISETLRIAIVNTISNQVKQFEKIVLL